MVFFVFTPLIGFSRLILALAGALLLGPIVAMVVAKGDSETIDDPDIQPVWRPVDESSWGTVLAEAFRDWSKVTLGYLVRMGPIMVVAGFASGLAIPMDNSRERFELSW